MSQDVIERIAELRLQARKRYEVIQSEIEQLNEHLSKLVEERNALAAELDIVAPGGRQRQPRGLLPQACLNALKANPSGLTSSQVADWISRYEPEVNPGSTPAILSRMYTEGKIKKSPTGYFSV